VYRTAAWRSVQGRVLDRDGRRCRIGLPGCSGEASAVDHIVELADGGEPYAMANLQAACRSCNTSKRNSALAARARRAGVRLRAW